MPRCRPSTVTALAVAAIALAGLLVATPTAGAADEPSEPVPWGVEAVHGAESLQRTSGGAGVDVAVLDTGVDRDHPDLRDRVERCRNYTSPTPRQGSCEDVDGHGTHVAGTVAADGGPDGEGIWGMAPEADVWAFKVCNDDGSCRTDRIGKAIGDAADLGAEVVVLSLGGEPEPFVQDALNESLRRDVLPVAAAGNAGPNLSTIRYPAADRLAVSVGALGRLRSGAGHDVDNLAVADFSSRGDPADAFAERDNLTEVAAPGFGVESTAVGGGYSRLSGTSMAAPHVAGLAARLWEPVGDADGDGKVRDDVRAAIRERAADGDVTEGRHATAGYDPAAGIGLPRLQAPVAGIEGPSVVLVDETATFVGSATGRSPIASYDWDLDGDGTVDATGPTVNTTYAATGTRTVELRATDTDGATAEATIEVRSHEPPVPRFQVDPPVPLAGEAFTLDASASSDDGTIASYGWDLDGDREVDRRGRTVTASLSTLGTHVVGLTVVDGDGAANGTTGEVLVNDRPTITLDVPAGGWVDEPVPLRAEVTDVVGDVTVTWDLPGGATATGATVEAVLPEGTQTVRATAADEHGASAAGEATIEVAAPGNAVPGAGELEEAPGPGLATALAALGAAAGLRPRWRT